MSVETVDHDRIAIAADTGRIIDWLKRIAERRDLSLTPPADSRAAAVSILLDAVSREFADYREVVAGARESARRNGDQLASVVRSTGEQGVLVRATAKAAAEAGNGASRMADAADALHTFAQAAAGAATDAQSNLMAIDRALLDLGKRLADGDRPLGEMTNSTAGVGGFLMTLARLSRHAQLLGVNASIEAAHLAEAGSRFGIVAQEVRKLSTSTRESRTDVSHIVSELRASTEQVRAAVNESKSATAAAGQEISGANGALAQTAHGFAEFETMVATVADLAATQRMALESIGASVEEIAHHAEDASQASRSAADLDLDTLLERAQRRVDCWSVRSDARPAAAGGHRELNAWIEQLAAGGDAAAHTSLDADPEFRSITTAVRTLLERVSAEQRDILGDVVAAAVAVSRNSYAWRSISQSLESVGSEIAVVRATVHESAGAARTSADLATGMRDLVETIRQQYEAALELLEGALGRIARITASVREIDGFVESMGSAAARADQIMGLIETLSAETDLLSLNAAIEAAHAGELGLGFSVIAEEIRALARSTNESTVSVTQLVSNISRISAELQASIGASADNMTDVVASAEAVRGAIGNLRGSFESAIAHALDVASTANEQRRALDGVLENVNRSSAAVEANTTSGTDTGRLELAMLGSRAHTIAARRPLGTVIERVRALTESLCTQIEAAIDTALSSGRVDPQRIFDLAYRPIDGPQIATLGRLFDVSRVPSSGFSPVKYATPWDGTIDEAVDEILTRAWEQATAESISPVAIFVSDLNGFFYAYPKQKIGAWTNDPAIDGLGNRIKRIFEDEYTLRVVRTGMGPEAGGLGPRTPYESFRSAGCTLGRVAARPWGGYVYARDTNAVCNEVAMAYYVRDQRHGAVRVCYDPNLI